MENVATLERLSVQEFEPKSSVAYGGIWNAMPIAGSSDGMLAPWGHHVRDRQLRNAYRDQYSWLAQSAVAAVARRVAQQPWTIQAGRNSATHFQSVLQQANLGAGWGEFVKLVLLDWLTADYGAYVEIIGAGRPDGPLKGRVLGISHLDSLRCIPTGNLEFPVIYYSRKTGNMHRLHRTRVARLVDMPDGDKSRHLAGLSALSRAIAMVEQQSSMMRYVNQMMDDTPPTGIISVTGTNKEAWDAAKKAWQLAKKNKAQAGAIELINNQNTPITVDFTQFAQAPADFKYSEYIDIAVNAFAAAFGIDRQDIFPLTGSMAGTATQSAVLFEKSRSMMFGDILSIFERLVNINILPASAEFKFEREDDEKAKVHAERDSVLLQNAQTMQALGVPQASIISYLAKGSEQMRNALTNDNGEIILPDDDPRDDNQSATPEADNGAIADNNSAQAAEDDAIATSNKAIQATRLEFENAFEDIQTEIRAGNLNRRRAGILIRGALSKAINKAYEDGLLAGGVDPIEATDEDRAMVKALIAAASLYVSNYTEVLISGAGISDAQAAQRSAMWFNKSVAPAYDAGLRSADANGMYEFVLGATEQHCGSCSALNGQVHRLKSFLDSGWFPRSDKLQCKGFRCDCRMVRTTKRANGRLSRVKAHCDVRHDHSADTHRHL